MASERVERRLTAILAADVAGYSRLMGVDEEGTLRQLKAHRRALVDPKIKKHHGHIVKTTGDGMLVEFASVVDAVRCAVEVQRGMGERNTDVAPEKRIEFRIGINVGDIIIDSRDIYGDGVNVAARLEALAEPGGVCVSGRVREDAEGKLDVVFEDKGEQQLKNIARPVRVYKLRLGRAGDTTKPALALPDKPSIAVLPFQNMSGDPEQEYFAEGMVEEIITALSRMRWLFVIARNSSFTYKGRPVDVKQVGRELGVRYLLEGSVRKAANRVRITGQLIDASTGAHLWADRFDGALDDIFALQDEITISVVGAIEPSVRLAEIERAKRKRPDSLDAYDLYLRALSYNITSIAGDAGKALPLLEEALKLEPDYAAAHALVAWCHEQRWLRGGFDPEDKAAGLQHAHAAIAAGADDATALAIAGFVMTILDRDYENAVNALDRARALSSSSALVLGFRSLVQALMGNSEAAIEDAKLALRLSPFDQLSYIPYIALTFAHFAVGHFEEAAEAASNAVQSNPRFSVPYQLQAATLARLGRMDEAKAVVRRLLEFEPGAVVPGFVPPRTADHDIVSAFSDALHAAGLPQ